MSVALMTTLAMDNLQSDSCYHWSVVALSGKRLRGKGRYMVCLQCKNCVIHTWALKKWAYDGVLYKSLFTICLPNLIYMSFHSWVIDPQQYVQTKSYFVTLTFDLLNSNLLSHLPDVIGANNQWWVFSSCSFFSCRQARYKQITGARRVNSTVTIRSLQILFNYE